MAHIKTPEPFDFSEDGLTVKHFEAGEHEDVSDLCAKYAKKYHGAEMVGEKDAKKEAPKKGGKK